MALQPFDGSVWPQRRRAVRTARRALIATRRGGRRTTTSLPRAYVLWLRTSEPAHVGYAIRGVRRLDCTIAKPAYGVLLVTGVLMVATGAFSFGEHWIKAAIALYVVTALLGFVVFAPAIRRQLAEAEADPSSVAYRAAARRTTGLGLLTMGSCW